MKKFLKFAGIACVVIFVLYIIAEWDELGEDSDKTNTETEQFNQDRPQSQEQIRIVNDSGYTMHYLYISPSSRDSWGSDLLGFGVLGDREFVYQLPLPIARENRYDIKLIDSDGDEYIKWRVAVSDNARIVFNTSDIVRYYDPVPMYISQHEPQPAPQPATQAQPRPPPQAAAQPAAQTQPPPPLVTQPPAQAAPSTQSGDQNAVRTAIVSAAQRYLGASYVYGAQTPPSRFDCSGLINQAYRDGGNMVIPRSSAEIWARGTRISRSQLQPGDIIVYSGNGGRTPTHVSMIMNSSEMIHAVSAGTPRGVIRQNQSSGSWPGLEIGYVTFIGVQSAVFRNFSKGMALTELLIDVTSTLDRGTEEIPVLKGSALGFVVTNSTGRDDQFDLYFYRAGSSRSNGETELLDISNREVGESRAYICDETGQYRLEIVRRSDNRTLLEYTYNVED